MQRSLVDSGDTVRLQRVLAKAQRGEPIVIGAIGGSITEGAKASDARHRYTNLVVDWWRKTFPRSRIELVNAGVGATNSLYGALRVQHDLLASHPDFVVVEFSVNDKAGPQCAETIEGLIRQILSQPQMPAVMMLFMMKDTGDNAAFWHAKVGKYYGIPMVSYREALWPEIQANRLNWTDLSPDHVHPNDRGMAYAASFVTHFLDGVLESLPTDAQVAAVPAIKKPLLSDRFVNTTLFRAAELSPTANVGWSFSAQTKSWESNQPGAHVEFDVRGESICLTYYRLRGGMGQARVQIDDGPPTTLDAWFAGTWGGYVDTVELGDGLSPGRHRIQIELLHEKNPESTGHEFRITAIGSAGKASR